MSTMLEPIRGVQRGDTPPPPIAQLLGFTLTEVEPGRGAQAAGR